MSDGDPRGTNPHVPGEHKVIYLLAPERKDRQLARLVWMLLTLVLAGIVGYVIDVGMRTLAQDWENRGRSWSTVRAVGEPA